MKTSLYHSVPRTHANRRGFSLMEMMTTVAVMGIAAAMVIPTFSGNEATYLSAAASIMIADLDYAQTTAISDPSEMSLVRFDTVNSRWWVAPESTPDTPYGRLYTNEPYDTTMGVGRAESAIGVTFTTLGVFSNRIAYNAFGRLDQINNAQIILKSGVWSTTIVIDAQTGFLKTE